MNDQIGLDDIGHSLFVGFAKLLLLFWLQSSSGAGQKPYTAVMIVPTGTGATIGGFAGDSLPVARAMSSVVDCLITHPNVSVPLSNGYGLL